MLLVIAYCLLVFTAGFRYETGVDWKAYSGIVDEILPINKIGTPEGYESVFEGIDVGFNLVISIIKFFGGGLQTLFFTLSSVSTAFLIFSLKRYLKYPLLGLILYYGLIFFYLDMSGMRQATSLCIFFYSIKYIASKQPLKYFGLLFIAFSFHWSTIFLFPLYWLLKFRANKAVVIALLCFGMGFYMLGVKWITSFVPTIFSVLQNTNFADKVIVYSTTDMFASDRGASARNIIHVFLLVSILLISEVYKKKLTERNSFYPIFHRLLVVQVLVFFTFYEFPEIAERVKLYFYISNIIILPTFLSAIKENLKKVTFIGFVFTYSLFYGNVHILEKPITIAYYPYQNYVIYKLFDLQSTGEERLNQHIANTEAVLK